MSWGNQNNTTENQNLSPNPANNNWLKVQRAGGDANPAAHLITADSSGVPALKVENSTAGGNPRAMIVNGIVEFNPRTTGETLTIHLHDQDVTVSVSESGGVVDVTMENGSNSVSLTSADAAGVVNVQVQGNTKIFSRGSGAIVSVMDNTLKVEGAADFEGRVQVGYPEDHYDLTVYGSITGAEDLNMGGDCELGGSLIVGGANGIRTAGPIRIANLDNIISESAALQQMIISR